MVCSETRFLIFLYIIARLRKPELIIRENQPIELPPEVVRGRHHCALQCLHGVPTKKLQFVFHRAVLHTSGIPVCFILTKFITVFFL